MGRASFSLVNTGHSVSEALLSGVAGAWGTDTGLCFLGVYCDMGATHWPLPHIRTDLPGSFDKDHLLHLSSFYFSMTSNVRCLKFSVCLCCALCYNP